MHLFLTDWSYAQLLALSHQVLPWQDESVGGSIKVQFTAAKRESGFNRTSCGQAAEGNLAPAARASKNYSHSPET